MEHFGLCDCLCGVMWAAREQREGLLLADMIKDACSLGGLQGSGLSIREKRRWLAIIANWCWERGHRKQQPHGTRYAAFPPPLPSPHWHWLQVGEKEEALWEGLCGVPWYQYMRQSALKPSSVPEPPGPAKTPHRRNTAAPVYWAHWCQLLTHITC